ncbi:MAG: hypothetical protein ACI8QC_000292 [Planctomycetota bacterium]|jgi:hypothetical protein
MNRFTHISAGVALTFLASCAITGEPDSGPIAAPSTDASRNMLVTLASLAGTWECQTPDGPFTIEFRSTAKGSAVHEIMMPGTENEMVNLYTVHGGGVNMTHYCAAGNQPHMRATAIDDGRMAFASTGVSGLEASDDHYMAAMTLVILDGDHIEQHWTGGDQDADTPAMVFELTRK